MPEALAQFGRTVGGGTALRLDLFSKHCAAHDRNAQRLRIKPGLLHVASIERRRVVKQAAFEPHGIEQGGAVAHAARNAQIRIRITDGSADRRRATAARLHAEQAVAARRNANRSAHVVAVRHRYDARSHEGARSAARTAGRARRIPGVSARPEQGRLRNRRETEFGRARLAEDVQPSALRTHDELVVARGHVLREVSAAARHHGTGKLRPEILHEKRDAGKRSFRQAGARVFARPVEPLANERVEFRVHALDARDCFVEQLFGRDLFRSHEFREPKGVIPVVLWKSAHDE